jgi:opacity protein-like surface antigen
MKMKLLVAAAFLALSVLPAAAAQGPYVGASVGLFMPHDADLSVPGLGTGDVEYDLGVGFTIKAGYKVDDFRIEGEFGYQTADVDNASGVDLTVLSYMVNGYYDFKVNSPLKPFVGVGVGLLNGEMDVQGFKPDDTVFGYQFTAGVAYPLDKNLNFDVYYRFQGSADFELDGADLSYTSSNINAGLRYNF